MKSVEKWMDKTLNDKDIPDDIVAFGFNLYVDDDGSWSMELVETDAFDLEEDWACDEVTDFGTGEDLYNCEMECEWYEAWEYMVDQLNQYLYAENVTSC